MMLGAQLPSIQSQDGHLLCAQCNSAYLMQEIARQAPEQAYNALQAAVVDSQVAKKYTELQGDFDRRLQEKVAEIIADYGEGSNPKLEIEAKRRAEEARNGKLNLACPHCNVVYFDFDGCMALVCESCKGNFCAYCHQGCADGRGSHQHVRECMMNETERGTYYATPEQLKRAQRRYRIRELKKFLRQFKQDVQNATVIELTRDLKDLGIDPAALFQVGANVLADV